MGLRGAVVFAVGISLGAATANAESPQSLIQRAVNSERAANQTDHSNWLYHEVVKKPKGGVVQWVAATQHGDVHRVCQRDGQRVPEAKQRDAVQEFLHNERAQKKSVEEDAHDAQQIDDFLKLLPVAFIWTETGADAVNTTLQHERTPDPRGDLRRRPAGKAERGKLLRTGAVADGAFAMAANRAACSSGGERVAIQECFAGGG